MFPISVCFVFCCCCFSLCSLASPVQPFFQPISISPTHSHYVMSVFEYNAMQKSYVKLIVFKLDFKLKLLCFFFVFFYNSLTYTQLKWGLYETLQKFEILGSVYVQVFPVSQASRCSKYTVFYFSYSWVYDITDSRRPYYGYPDTWVWQWAVDLLSKPFNEGHPIRRQLI